MIGSRNFLLVSGADFTVRSAYQMGKTPLLPLFAASLGAGDMFLGLIVSVSSLTGMIFKPVFGILSDRWGRRIWLIIGTGFFVGMPFFYRFINTPEQLLAIRVFHGIGTAIYGPVTLAYVAEISKKQQAERLGWFSLARNVGYVVGPISAGWMLLTMDPVTVFTVIGLLSSIAFIPTFSLRDQSNVTSQKNDSIFWQSINGLWSGARTPGVWVSGAMNANIFVIIYAARAFVPLHILDVGMSVLLAGVFFSVQQATHIIITPIGGRISDKIGHLNAASAGMIVLAISAILLTTSTNALSLTLTAVLMGLAQSLVLPSTLALVSAGIDEQHMGLGMGLVGSLKNAGKVAGPALAGILMFWLEFERTFLILGLIMLAVGFILFARSIHCNRPTKFGNK